MHTEVQTPRKINKQIDSEKIDIFGFIDPNFFLILGIRQRYKTNFIKKQSKKRFLASNCDLFSLELSDFNEILYLKVALTELKKKIIFDKADFWHRPNFSDSPS